jgi:hypothetical protein
MTEGTCTLEAIDDASVYLVASDTPGDSVMTVEGDADVGSGVETILDTVLVHVQHPHAASLGLAADLPILR